MIILLGCEATNNTYMLITIYNYYGNNFKDLLRAIYYHILTNPNIHSRLVDRKITIYGIEYNTHNKIEIFHSTDLFSSFNNFYYTIIENGDGIIDLHFLNNLYQIEIHIKKSF